MKYQHGPPSMKYQHAPPTEAKKLNRNFQNKRCTGRISRGNWTIEAPRLHHSPRHLRPFSNCFKVPKKGGHRQTRVVWAVRSFQINFSSERLSLGTHLKKGGGSYDYRLKRGFPGTEPARLSYVPGTKAAGFRRQLRGALG